jgi:hypothetical protein
VTAQLDENVGKRICLFFLADGLFGAPLDMIEFKVIDELGLTSAIKCAEVHVNQIYNK